MQPGRMQGDLPQDIYLIKMLCFTFATILKAGLVNKCFIFFLMEDAVESGAPLEMGCTFVNELQGIAQIICLGFFF